MKIDHIPTTNWIFLLGKNGAGKTSVLRSIAIGFIGDKDGKEILVDNFDTRIGIEYFDGNKSKIKNLWNNQNSKPIQNVVFYGPFRLELQKDSSENEENGRSSISHGLFNSYVVLLSIEYELKKLHWKGETDKFDFIVSALCKLTGFYDITISENDQVLYYEPEDSHRLFEPVIFNELASGFRSIIAMVGDMMIRLFKTQPTITNPSDLVGIVIIDEFDLHLHPKIQRQMPKLLSSIFPKVQFIVSTHSLVPLLGAPENSVLLKVNRDTENGITAEKVDIDFQALSTDTMFRDIFDIDYMSDAKMKAWERFLELRRLIDAETDDSKKENNWNEQEQLADKYQFEL